MKKLLLILAISTLVYLPRSTAQQGPYIGPLPDPKAQTEKMAADLHLNDDQKAKVLAINAKKQNEQDWDAALKAVLTKDQFNKFTQLREDARKQRKNKGGELAPNGGAHE